MSSNKRSSESKKIKEEKDRQLEMFRQKREKIAKEKENKRKMSMKVSKIQLELFVGENQKPDDDELSVSSGESGQEFVKNLMGFWT